MDHYGLSLRFGAVAVVFAVAVRLFAPGGILPMAALPGKEWLSALIFLQNKWETDAEEAQTEATAPEPTHQQEEILENPTVPELTQPEAPNYSGVMQPLFSGADMGNIAVHYGCSYRPELEALLMDRLSWNLMGDEPTVLIIHSHATECYTPSAGESFDFSGSYRTLNEQYNMVSIGAEVAKILEEGGITVLHDRTLHDHPSYNQSYASSRTSVEDYLARYPSIRLVLDIHRDASGSLSGELTTSAHVDGENSSQLMLVVGTHSPEDPHENWQRNLSLALKLQALLQRENPGLCRPVNLRDWRFNQDLAVGSLLVEVGAAGDSHAKALIAARALAEGILAMAYGSATASSTR